MNCININFENKTGKIKPMHAINNAPLYAATSGMFHYIGEAGIPYSRLHDTGGAYGNNRFVDIENIFRNWDADENDPKSYDFAFTDWLLLELKKQNAEPFFRLGATIENQHYIKAYRIFPPKDNLKWAKICEHIIAHYNEGWADGYFMNIKYWEIWNEPDNTPDIKDNPMWKGTFEEYIEMYRVTAKHLRARFGDSIKIGGYASCGFYAIIDSFNAEANSSPRTEYFVECFHKFMQAVQNEKLPLDFFSWHSYSDLSGIVTCVRYVKEQLTKYGCHNTEIILNEWNPGTHLRGTLEDAARISAVMLAMQNEDLDLLMYYDGQLHGYYQGMFNPVKHEPYKAYYVFKYFDFLYRLENSVSVEYDVEDLFCVAAENGRECSIMVTNVGDDKKIRFSLDGLDLMDAQIYRINECDDPDESKGVSLLDDIQIGKFETVLINIDLKR